MTEVEMLSFWEIGSRLSPLDRGVLAAEIGGVVAAQAADLPLGERNRALARLYCEHFGNVLEGFTQCGACGEKLEFQFDARNVADAPPLNCSESVTVGRWIFALPTSRALAVALNGGDEVSAGHRLLVHCLREPAEPDPLWSDEEVRTIEAKLAEADALAEIVVSFECPQCGHCFEDALDLENFLWAEIEDSARHLLDDIHLLASAYGWTEGEVLALSSKRRMSYVQRILG